MKKKALFLVLIVLVIAVFAAYRFLYKDHRDINSETAAFTLTVAQLHAEFATHDSLANAKYADQTIEVGGKVTAFDASAHTIVIDEKLSAVLTDTLAKGDNLQKQIKIKGRFVGYDDLLEELKMDQVTIIN
jgi:hypothetical protein